MAQLLAIEWDAREIRFAVGRSKGKDLTVEHAFAVPLGERSDGTAAEEWIGKRIGEELRRRGIGRVETLVAVGRANIELRQLSLPPVPADELPEIVRFQALRQFTTIGEDWPLDFVPIGGTESDSTSVLAAAISPDQLSQIRRTCEAADLTPKRVVLRPFAAASLLARQDAGTLQSCRLMVDLLAEDADLSVLDGEQLVLTRTVRLHVGEDGQPQPRGLLGELRRTIAAANNQLAGRRVEKVVLCGDTEDLAAIRSLIESELSLEVEVFHPFGDVKMAGESQERPTHAGRFAPLLGLLLDEATASQHAIDFLHPRKKVERTDVRRRGVLIGATVATMALAAVLLVWLQLSDLDDEIMRLRAKSMSLDMKVKEAEKVRKDALTVETFLDHNFNWLEEMEQLAERLPPAEEVILTKLSFSAAQQGGEMRLEGYTRGPTDFQKIEERLRQANRSVSTAPLANDPKREKYQYGFVERVKIAPPEDQATSKGTPAKSGAKADSASAAGSASGGAKR